MKNWWQSKTVLLNLVTAGAAVLTTLAGQDLVKDNPQLSAAVAGAIAVVNIALRFVTIVPIR